MGVRSGWAAGPPRTPRAAAPCSSPLRSPPEPHPPARHHPGCCPPRARDRWAAGRCAVALRATAPPPSTLPSGRTVIPETSRYSALNGFAEPMLASALRAAGCAGWCGRARAQVRRGVQHQQEEEDKRQAPPRHRLAELAPASQRSVAGRRVVWRGPAAPPLPTHTLAPAGYCCTFALARGSSSNQCWACELAAALPPLHSPAFARQPPLFHSCAAPAAWSTAPPPSRGVHTRAAAGGSDGRGAPPWRGRLLAFPGCRQAPRTQARRSGPGGGPQAGGGAGLWRRWRPAHRRARCRAGGAAGHPQAAEQL